MKKLVLVTALLLSVVTLQAQDKEDYLNLIKSNLNLEVKSFIYEELQLTSAEREAFSPVFNKYLDESGEVSVKKTELFENYATNIASYTPDQINDLNKELIKTDLQKVKTDKKYYNKFVKAIGVKKATNFFFLKKYLDNVVEGAKLDFLANE
ncbi:hypothetical protein [Joostella sp.]|uniref:hypothetical protein n=1 Tax=Joostella sp. TaxID=2231138 RepID=UPI003A93B063